MKSKLEYIWLDGSVPTHQLRAKTRIANNFSGKLEEIQYNAALAINGAIKKSTS